MAVPNGPLGSDPPVQREAGGTQPPVGLSHPAQVHRIADKARVRQPLDEEPHSSQ